MNRCMALFFCALLLHWSSPLIASKNAPTLYTKDNSFPFSTLKGKWVFINYWASWCHACIEEIAELNHFYEKNKENSVALFAVNYDGLSAKEQIVLAQQFGLTYPSLNKDPMHDLHLEDIQVLPVTFIFNPQGELYETLYGSQTATHLNTYLKN